MKSIFDDVSYRCSKLTTRSYSTSFSLGIRFLNKNLRNAIYGIYGFVRFADEIVDTFHEYDKKNLLDRFRQDAYSAIDEQISLNPILNSFQAVVNQYGIERDIIDAFLKSMEMDLDKSFYSRESYEEYILGSAEVVGLMCLRVFCNGEDSLYQSLKPDAMRLGSAYQKVNFLRDLKADFDGLGRSYFPNISIENFSNEDKQQIIEEIKEDFDLGYRGIKGLPKNSRFGVYMTYVYYNSLLKKIRRTKPSKILSSRIRIPNNQKYALFLSSYVRHSLNII